MSQVILPSQYVTLILDELSQTPHFKWGEVLGFTPERLAEPLVSMPLDEFQQLILSAVSQTNEPALGLLVGSRLQPNTHGMLGYAAMSSQSIRQVLTLLERFIYLRENVLAISHHEVGPKIEIHFSQLLPLGDAERPVMEAVVLAIKNLLDFISMGLCQVEQVLFSVKSAGYDELAGRLFGCAVNYDASKTAIILPLKGVDEPLRLSDANAFQEAAKLCEEELARRHGNVSIAARIRKLMLQTHGEPLSLTVAARYFYMTPRTLHRHLDSEGTAFREIQEEVRHTLAQEHLKAGRLTVKEIAYALGYTDIANFRRAFKRWEGVAPSEYRAQLGLK